MTHERQEGVGRRPTHPLYSFLSFTPSLYPTLSIFLDYKRGEGCYGQGEESIHTHAFTQPRDLGVSSLSRLFVTPYCKLEQEHKLPELDIGTFGQNQYNLCVFPCDSIRTM
jgi:hypothetical protein